MVVERLAGDRLATEIGVILVVIVLPILAAGVETVAADSCTTTRFSQPAAGA